MEFAPFGIRYSSLYLLVYVIELAKSGKSANQVQNNSRKNIRKSKKIGNYVRNDVKAIKYLFGQKILCPFGTFKHE